MLSYQIDWYAVLTFLLVIVTGYYAWKTAKILEESQKTRKAVERQALAMEESNKLLRQQIEEASGIGREIVRSTIQTTLRNIQYWNSQNLSNLAFTGALPQDIYLLPPEAQSALHHARLISPDGAVELSSCFDNLRHALQEIEEIRDSKIHDRDRIKDHVNKVSGYIQSASSDLDKAMVHFQEDSIPVKKA